jgi:hypothetical protein
MRTIALISGSRWLQAFAMTAGLMCSHVATAQVPQTPAELVNAMTSREGEAVGHHDHYTYLSSERSERTGGHLWTERVVETNLGRVRYLLAEDGVPLSPERVAAERARMAQILAKPDEFARRELEANKGDDLRARSMLTKLPHGFVLENVRLENGVWTLNYRPDPNYSPNGPEDRVLHNMSGSFSIDAHDYRLVHLDGHMSGDVSFGMGFLATLRAGSNFSLDKSNIQGNWRAVHATADCRGKAILFKTIARNTDFTRSDFQRLDSQLTLDQAVALAQR